jgi:hypothetical protein
MWRARRCDRLATQVTEAGLPPVEIATDDFVKPRRPRLRTQAEVSLRVVGRPGALPTCFIFGRFQQPLGETLWP